MTRDEAIAIVRDEQYRRSESLSNLTRNLAYALIALVWGVLVLGEADANAAVTMHRDLLVWCGIGCLVALAFDWLQGFAAFRVVRRTAVEVDAKELSTVEYNWNDPLYRCSTYLFYLKHLVVLVSLGAFLYGVIPSLLKPVEKHSTEGLAIPFNSVARSELPSAR